MVHKLPQMQDMRITPKDQADSGMPFSIGIGQLHDCYPCGLSISLTDREFEKLKLESPEIGDMIHIFALAKVTSVSERDGINGKECRAELQITHIGLEDEDEEDRDEDTEMEPELNRFRAKVGKSLEPTAKAERDINDIKKRKLYDAMDEEEDEGYTHETEPGEPSLPPRGEAKKAVAPPVRAKDKEPSQEEKDQQFGKLLKRIGAKVTPKRAMAYSHKGHEPSRSKHGAESVAAPQYNGHSEDDLEARNARR